MASKIPAPSVDPDAPMKCPACNKYCYPQDRPVLALSNKWHPNCLKCTTCKRLLNTKTLESYAMKPYCKTHVPKTTDNSIKASEVKDIRVETAAKAQNLRDTKQQGVLTTETKSFKAHTRETRVADTGIHGAAVKPELKEFVAPPVATSIKHESVGGDQSTESKPTGVSLRSAEPAGPAKPATGGAFAAARAGITQQMAKATVSDPPKPAPRPAAARPPVARPPAAVPAPKPAAPVPATKTAPPVPATKSAPPKPAAPAPVAKPPAAAPKPPAPAPKAAPVPAPEPVYEEPAAEPYYEEPAAEPYYEEPAAEPYAEPAYEPAAEPYYEEPAAEPYYEEPAAEPYYEEPAAEGYDAAAPAEYYDESGAAAPYDESAAPAEYYDESGAAPAEYYDESGTGEYYEG